MKIYILSIINGFIKPKHLVAFLGVDSSVNQSGKFQSDENRISKRGIRIEVEEHYML